MSLDFLKVQRNEDGQVVPKKGTTPTLGLKIEVLPITYGQALSYESFGKPIKNWTKAEKARLVSENLVTVEGEDVDTITEEEVDEFEAYSFTDMVEGIAIYSALSRLYQGDAEEEQGNEEGPPAE